MFSYSHFNISDATLSNKFSQDKSLQNKLQAAMNIYIYCT